MGETNDSSYIDYETFLDPNFSPTSFANTLVLATNNPSDQQLDLKTPLSRVLFDVQEVDTHIDSLTTQNAVPLLNHTKTDVEAGTRILGELEAQVANLTESYSRLERDVIQRHEEAKQTQLATERLWETVKLGRSVTRCLTLGRQLDAQLGDMPGTGAAGSKKEDFRVLVRASNTILGFHQLFRNEEEGQTLNKVNVIKTLRMELIEPAGKRIISRAEQVVSQFSMSTLTASNTDTSAHNGTSNITTPQQEDMRSRATSALQTLYLLSPVSDPSKFEPTRLISVLQEYLRRAITSSLAGLTGALTALPKLERSLLEVSARCQNIVALEMLLESIQPPPHLLLDEAAASEEQAAKDIDEVDMVSIQSNLLQPLLSSLDTSSLPSYFWRSMSSQLSSRVQKILRDGGVSARTLRSNKERVGNAIRECVNRGSQLPSGSLIRSGSNKPVIVRNWEREAAVMVGSVVNVLSR